ncbi:PREDICTED: uncharacterized protein LOC106308462 [Brassica oleracea var. oleracea]|uniref:uncharacterized protein LOC106308462 n=1 Tax=Brassica oleracea var. oleracea TaxID=109376 RepID=UPI0006A74FB6|nr:PREDICTED: uncharacterized protein LOC106308462 [Brassica oleracea var. oleracea]
MSEKIHQVTSAAPQIESVLATTSRTPFTSALTSVQLGKIEKLRLPEYKPGGDPVEHMTTFNIAMARARLPEEERDAGYCQLFVETLHEQALTWFSQLEENSIGSFRDLSAAFLKTYIMFTTRSATASSLWNLNQTKDQSLRDYMEKLKVVASRIEIPDVRVEGWNKWVRELDSLDKPVDTVCTTQPITGAGSAAGPSRTVDLTKHCKYHDVKGHDTTECKSLYAHYLSSLASGEFKFEPLKAKPKNGKSWSKNKERRAQRKATGKDLRRQLEQAKGHFQPPTHDTNISTDLRTLLDSKRVQTGQSLNVIIGGSPPSGDTVRSVKDYRRQVATSQKWPTKPTSHLPITFSPDDAEGVHAPHNDPLLVVLGIGEYDVTKILIDTGSSVNLIFRGTLQKMGVDLDDIKASSRTLTRFNGSSETILGTICLPVRACGVTRTVKFAVVSTKAPYHAILGTPWLHSMQAVPSTYHQCVKFPGTDGRIKTLLGDQKAARDLLVVTVKLQRSSLPVNFVSPPTSKVRSQESEGLELTTPIKVEP